jgi:hypothetical protein
VICVNAYFLWKVSSSTYNAHSYRSHRDFMETLCTQLLHLNDQNNETESFPTLPIGVLIQHHKHIQIKPRGRCEWGKRHPPGCLRKRPAKKRKFGTDITEEANNDVDSTILGGSHTHHKCSKCQIWLCIQGDCWQQYHHSIGVNC